LYVVLDNVGVGGITDLSREKALSPGCDCGNRWQNPIDADVLSCWRRIAGFGVRNEERFCCCLLCPDVGEGKVFGNENEEV